MKVVTSLILGLAALGRATAFDYGLVQTDEESVRVLYLVELRFLAIFVAHLEETTALVSPAARSWASRAFGRFLNFSSS
jgi:hypothetical protein